MVCVCGGVSVCVCANDSIHLVVQSEETQLTHLTNVY